MQTVRVLTRHVEEELTLMRDARRQARSERAFMDEAARLDLRELHVLAMAAIGDSAKGGDMLRLLIDIADEGLSQEKHDVAQRQQADVAIRSALSRLRELDSSAEMSRRAPAELRDACGFTRVMISSARGSRWLPDTMRRSDHADPDAAEFARFARDGNEIPLAHLMPETEMMRHRVPVIVPESGAHAYPALMEVTKSTSYVAAPVVTTRRVIGFFHADRFGQSKDVTQGDLDSIAMFASEFGVLFEHAALHDRARQQRANWTAALLATIDGPDPRKATLRPPTLSDDARPGADPRDEIDWRAEIHRHALTERERQVLDLLATGATNRLIAQELVLSVDTVKTHIKNIMNKLHATSRADAVAQYLQPRRRQVSPA
jgi:DNA-binding CsgD family transcriptional regulator